MWRCHYVSIHHMHVGATRLCTFLRGVGAWRIIPERFKIPSLMTRRSGYHFSFFKPSWDSSESALNSGAELVQFHHQSHTIADHTSNYRSFASNICTKDHRAIFINVHALQNLVDQIKMSWRESSISAWRSISAFLRCPFAFAELARSLSNILLLLGSQTMPESNCVCFPW